MKNMFNLEQSITSWRQQMLTAGIQSPVPLEELELHLREEIEREIKSGWDEARAFELSTQGMGQPQPLKNEFKKTERPSMNRKLALLVGIFILLIGTAMILPALGNHQHHNEAALAAGANYFTIEWAHNEIVGLAWGIPIAFGGLVTAVYGLRKRKA